MAARPDDVEVDVAILHPDPGVDAGPLTWATATARLSSAETHVRGFLAVGATRAAVVSGPPDGRSFGARLRDLVADLGSGGLIVLGSGSIPLASARDRRELVDTARGRAPRALTNNRYSGDVIAVARARATLADVPDLASDNALPRWLEETGVPVEDRRRRTRLGVDIDGPLDLVLLGGRWSAYVLTGDRAAVDDALARIRQVIERSLGRARGGRPRVRREPRLAGSPHRVADTGARRGTRYAHATGRTAVGGERAGRAPRA